MFQPLRVWMAPPGPNPWKVIIILEELNVPYEIVSFSFADVKKKPFIDLNPNGRAPAIEDPNTNLVLWESGAIVQYLVEQYDTERKLTYDTVEKHKLNQWLMFQMSGQGPYFGQAGWFITLHPEKLPSAIKRYTNELYRILSVLDNTLQGKQWLVGDKCTFADLSFVTWNERVDAVLLLPSDKDKFEGFPNVKTWHERMISRQSWKVAMKTRARLMDEQGLMWNGMPKGITNMAEYEEKMKKNEEMKGTQ